MASRLPKSGIVALCSRGSGEERGLRVIAMTSEMSERSRVCCIIMPPIEPLAPTIATLMS